MQIKSICAQFNSLPNNNNCSIQLYSTILYDCGGLAFYGTFQSRGHTRHFGTLLPLYKVVGSISYNVTVAKRSRNIDHILTFLQLGIYKIGYIFGIGFLLGTFT